MPGAKRARQGLEPAFGDVVIVFAVQGLDVEGDAGGLREVRNPSAIFLSRHETPVSGSVVMVTHGDGLWATR